MKLTARARVLLVLGLLVVLALVVATGVAVRQRLRDGRPLVLTRPGHVFALAFAPSGDRLLAVERAPGRGSIIDWREPDGTLASEVSDELSPTGMAVSPRGDVVAVAHSFGEITLLSSPGRETLGKPFPSSLFSHTGPEFGTVSAVRFSPSGERVAASGPSSSLSIWNMATREKLDPPRPTNDPPFDPETIEDCERFLGFVTEDTVAYATTVSLHIWSITKQAVIAELPTESREQSVHALSPRGTLWASHPDSGESHPVTIRSLPTGARVGVPLIIDGVDRIAFSPDDELVAVAGDQRVFIQEVATGNTLFSTPLPHSPGKHVTSVVFSPTRNRLAVARGDTIFVFPFRRW